MPANIDQLLPERSLIDLNSHSNGDFGLEDYVLSKLFSDIILVEFIDIDEAGDNIMRNGIFIPVNATTKAWRKAKVVLRGTGADYCKVGDIVMFPNDKGVTVSNIKVRNYGTVKMGMFLNEARIFGICQKD